MTTNMKSARWGAFPERITMAACQYRVHLERGSYGYPGDPEPGTLVLCGFRHHHIHQQLMLLRLDPVKFQCEKNEVQGFLPSHGRFVTRREAALIAVAAGQIKPELIRGDELYSEDLW